jgi:hypothetical protein
LACWADLEMAAPDVAAPGRELVERFGYVLAGTIRRDGTPRISPVEAHFVEGELMLAMMPGTLKARDLLRDPRLVLNVPIDDPHDPGFEFKLRGRAVAVEDPALRRATADTIKTSSGWRPREDWHFFSIDVEDASLMLWVDGALRMTRWSRSGGLEEATRPPPDVD